MKQKRTLLALLAGLLTTVTSADAATLVLDDFTQGSFAVSESYPTMYEPNLALPIGGPASRTASGRGFAYWHGSSSPQNGGSMNYTLELRGDPPYGVNYLDVYYRRSEVFDLSGYGAFSLAITNLAGQGEVMVYSGGFPDGTPVPITGTGDLVIPFSKMNSPTALDNFSSLHFRLIGLTADFSVTLDQIALVPEPGCLALTVLGGLTLLRRRRS